jgi:ASC-1-like (ASCH) protein
MNLSDYVTNVRTMIRDTDSGSFIFEDTEIESFVQAGVLFYSRYNARKRPYTLTLSPGVKQYTLSDDWMSVDQVSFNEAVGVKVVDLRQYAGFVLPTLNAAPSFNELDFVFYDEDQYLIVSPSPMENANIDFDYYGSHTISKDACTVPQIDSHAVTLASASQALDALAIDRGLKMQKYKVGQNLQIDDTEVAKRLQEMAQRYYDKFEQLVRYRPFGVMG